MFTKVQDGHSSPSLIVRPYAGMSVTQAAAVTLGSSPELFADTKCLSCNTKSFADLLSAALHGHVVFWLASQGDRVVGVAFSRIMVCGERKVFNVLYSRTNQAGVAEEAMDQMLDWAKQAGATDVEFEGRPPLGRWWRHSGLKHVLSTYRMELA